jgi:hypothetical protein
LLSLTLNLALAGVLLVWNERKSSPAPAVAIEPIQQATPVVVPPAPVVETATSNAAPALLPFRWAMLETNDVRAYVANLREVDCPEHVLRELLITKVERSYKPRLQSEPVYYEPWAGRDRREADRRMERGRLAGLRREQAGLIRELLGYDWNSEAAREWNRESAAAVFLGFLTDLKAQQVMAEIFTSAQQLEEQFSSFESRIIIDEDIERVGRVRLDIVAELNRFLTPQELDELETRAQLGLLFTRDFFVEGMEATGAELRAIMNASRSYRDVFTAILLERRLRSDEREINPKRPEFEAALLTALGPARFAEFKRAQEKGFRDAFEFTKRNELPRATAIALYEAQRTAEMQRQEISSDPSFSAEERKMALEVLQAATAASVANTLGQQFTNYSNGNGRWIRQLSAQTNDKRGEYRR